MEEQKVCFLTWNSATIYSSFHVLPIWAKSFRFRAILGMNKPAFAWSAIAFPSMPSEGRSENAESNYFSRISSFWISFSGTEREKSHPGNICSGENFIKNIYIYVCVYFFWIICTIFVLRRSWIQVYQLVDSTIFSGPANCITSYDMTSLGLSGNLFHQNGHHLLW